MWWKCTIFQLNCSKKILQAFSLIQRKMILSQLFQWRLKPHWLNYTTKDINYQRTWQSIIKVFKFNTLYYYQGNLYIFQIKKKKKEFKRNLRIIWRRKPNRMETMLWMRKEWICYKLEGSFIFFSQYKEKNIKKPYFSFGDY